MSEGWEHFENKLGVEPCLYWELQIGYKKKTEKDTKIKRKAARTYTEGLLTSCRRSSTNRQQNHYQGND
jgi:hypothetical protein